MKGLKFHTYIYLFFWSLIIGIAVAAYLQTVNWVIDFVWKIVPAWLHLPTQYQTLILILPLSILIGLVQKYLGHFPVTIEEILTELKIKGHFSFQNWWKILLCGLLILGAGGSIGPEASASGLLAGMIYWLGSRYKQVQVNKNKLANLSWSKQLKFIWLQKLDLDNLTEPITAYFKNKRAKNLFYICFTLVGLVGMMGFFKFFPQEGVIGIHTSNINWQWQGLLVIIPSLLVGYLFGKFFVWTGEFGQRWLAKNDEFPILKAIIGGIMLIVAAMFTKDILFSGEFSIQRFAHSSLGMTPLFLFSFAILKAIVTNFGFALGWRGGTIFPAIFSSLAIGALLAHYLPWMPQLTVSLVVATSLTIILENPWVVAIVLWLLLPIQFGLFILLTTLLVSYGMKKAAVLHQKKF